MDDSRRTHEGRPRAPGAAPAPGLEALDEAAARFGGDDPVFPSSTGALDVLAEVRRLTSGDGLVFPGLRGGMLGANAVALATAGINATGHGFRSSFKDWARHEGVEELLSEFSLAHVEGSATVAAYARDDLLEKRRPVMQRWADTIGG